MQCLRLRVLVNISLELYFASFKEEHLLCGSGLIEKKRMNNSFFISAGANCTEDVILPLIEAALLRQNFVDAIDL
jgi:hypothetical protein